MPQPNGLFRPRTRLERSTCSRARDHREVDVGNGGYQSVSQTDTRFKKFLATNLYPQTISWVFPNDVVITAPNEYAVRNPRGTAQKFAEQKYAEGLAKAAGIELRAICANGDWTFATIFVPADDTDAQYHFMGTGLKLSCPTERMSVTIVRNPLKWLFLSRRDAGRSRELFG
jgi:hypothetical protein